MKKLKAFENDLFDLIKNVEFNSFKSRFQKQLKHDINKLLIKKIVIVKSDKTGNLYYANAKLYKN